ncbi:MAG: hypothetical protein AB7H90_06330 [Alphaproteobacteria bacterium]
MAAGTVDRVYVYSPDRLAHRYAYQVVWIDEFRCLGVEIVFFNRAVGLPPEDDLLLQVQGMVDPCAGECPRDDQSPPVAARGGRTGWPHGAEPRACPPLCGLAQRRPCTHAFWRQR